MTIVSRLLLNAKMRTAPLWQAPVWQVNPQFTSKVVGAPVAVSAGSFTGAPTPTITYLISVDGAFKTWPYTLTNADAGKTLRVVVLLTNALGSAASIALTAVPTTLYVPGAVVGASAINASESGMTVIFSPPINGGTPSNYTLGYRVLGSSTWNNQTTSSLSVDLAGLTASTTYEIQIIANNAVGSGPAVIFQRATSVAGAGFWPTTDLGANIPGDKNYGSLKAFSNRFLSDNGTISGYTALDATTGYPTSTFTKTLWATTVGATNCPAGDWVFSYTADQQLIITAGIGSLTSSTYNATTKVGTLLWNTPSTTQAFVVNFTTVTTSMVVYEPADGATFLGGTTPPFWRAQWLRYFTPYDYHRFMDVSGVNGDYMAGYSTASATFKSPVNWSDRVTPATYLNNNVSNRQAGWPLEWQIDLCVQTNKPGWYNITALASDDYVTQFATLVAQTHPAGKWAAFEFGNELWNTAGGICSLQKCQFAALTEVDGYLPTNIAGANPPPSFFTFMLYNRGVAGITIDGAGKVIVRMNTPHGIASGNPTNRKIQLKGFASTPLKNQYDTANGAGTAVVLTVEDTYRVSFPTTNLTAVSEVDGTAILTAKTGFVSLNADAELMVTAGAASQDNLHFYWCQRRQYQVAQLVRAAWAAAGRTLSECKTLFMQQAGGYQNIEQKVEQLYAALGYTAPLNTVFSAVSVGGYLQLNQSTVHPGFGLTGRENTPSGADASAMATSVIAQLQQMVDTAYAVSAYGSIAAWAKSVGLEAWVYEIGLDTYGTGVSSGQVQLDGKVAAQSDSRMTTLLRDWLWALQGIGFTKLGWYQCGAGSFNLTGCFNLVNAAADGDYTTDPSLQGAKFKGIQAARSTPASTAARPLGFSRTTGHIVPCTLSGYDYSGNEPITTGGTNVWPSLSIVNNVLGYSGAKAGGTFNGLAYFAWSETARSVTLTVNGHNTSGTARAFTASVLGSGVSSSITAPGSAGSAAAGVNFPSVTLNLLPGANWIFLSAPSTYSANIFPHSLTFS